MQPVYVGMKTHCEGLFASPRSVPRRITRSHLYLPPRLTSKASADYHGPLHFVGKNSEKESAGFGFQEASGEGVNAKEKFHNSTHILSTTKPGYKAKLLRPSCYHARASQSPYYSSPRTSLPKLLPQQPAWRVF